MAYQQHRGSREWIPPVPEERIPATGWRVSRYSLAALMVVFSIAGPVVILIAELDVVWYYAMLLITTPVITACLLGWVVSFLPPKPIGAILLVNAVMLVFLLVVLYFEIAWVGAAVTWSLVFTWLTVVATIGFLLALSRCHH